MSEQDGFECVYAQVSLGFAYEGFCEGGAIKWLSFVWYIEDRVGKQ